MLAPNAVHSQQRSLVLTTSGAEDFPATPLEVHVLVVNCLSSALHQLCINARPAVQMRQRANTIDPIHLDRYAQ